MEGMRCATQNSVPSQPLMKKIVMLSQARFGEKELYKLIEICTTNSLVEHYQLQRLILTCLG